MSGKPTSPQINAGPGYEQANAKDRRYDCWHTAYGIVECCVVYQVMRHTLPASTYMRRGRGGCKLVLCDVREWRIAYLLCLRPCLLHEKWLDSDTAREDWQADAIAEAEFDADTKWTQECAL